MQSSESILPEFIYMNMWFINDFQNKFPQNCSSSNTLSIFASYRGDNLNNVKFNSVEYTRSDVCRVNLSFANGF